MKLATIMGCQSRVQRPVLFHYTILFVAVQTHTIQCTQYTCTCTMYCTHSVQCHVQHIHTTAHTHTHTHAHNVHVHVDHAPTVHTHMYATAHTHTHTHMHTMYMYMLTMHPLYTHTCTQQHTHTHSVHARDNTAAHTPYTHRNIAYNCTSTQPCREVVNNHPLQKNNHSSVNCFRQPSPLPPN